jgi:hypothetical protein
LGFEVVDIYVGPERQRYVVHKKLLTSQSEYFDKAFNGSFKEADENSIHLKEEDPAALALLVGWLYGRGVITDTEKPTKPFVNNAIFSSSESVTIPVSEEGTAYPFLPTVPPFNNTLLGFGTVQDLFQHLCGQVQYAIFSPEELRLADYKLHR